MFKLNNTKSTKPAVRVGFKPIRKHDDDETVTVTDLIGIDGEEIEFPDWVADAK